MTDAAFDAASQQALALHMAQYGRPGVPVETPWIPTAGELARFVGFTTPDSARQLALRFDDEQAARLFAGYPGAHPDDRWSVIASGDAMAAAVGFYRSVDGRLLIALELTRGRSGWITSSMTWETAPTVVGAGASLPTALGAVLEVCRWVLRMDPAPQLG